MSLPDQPYHKDLENNFLSTKQLIELNKQLDYFWKKWKTEYLHVLELRNAHRLAARKGVKRLIYKGEVVIIEDTDLPKGFILEAGHVKH